MEATLIEKPLFNRLGGKSGISQLVEDTVKAHMENPAINARFLPYLKDPSRLEKIKQHTIDFFILGSGGPATYSGRDMITAHTGMNISPAEYMNAIDDIFLAMDKQKINEETKKDVLAILWSLKNMIISK